MLLLSTLPWSCITSWSLISSGWRIFRTPLLLTSGRSCHKLNLEVEFLSKHIWGTALLSSVFVASVCDAVSSVAVHSSASVCESCSRLVSISWRVDLSRYSWYKSPTKHQSTQICSLNVYYSSRAMSWSSNSSCYCTNFEYRLSWLLQPEQFRKRKAGIWNNVRVVIPNT